MKDPVEEKPKIDESAITGFSQLKTLDKLDSLVKAADQLAPKMKGKSIPDMGAQIGSIGKNYNLSPSLLQKLEDLILDRDYAKKLKKAIDDKKLTDAGPIRGQHAGFEGFTEKDVIDMGQMLYAETDWARNETEHEAIIQVALNRTAQTGKTIFDVVKPTTGGWNNGPIYRSRYHKALLEMEPGKNARWEKAKKTIIRSLSGMAGANVGDANHFLHPNGMVPLRGCTAAHHRQSCPENEERLCYDFDRRFPGINAGARCVPIWAVHKSEAPAGKQPGSRRTWVENASATWPRLFGKALVSGGSGGSGAVATGGSSKAKTVNLQDGIVTNNSKSNIVAIGDSITASRGSWADRLGIKKMARGGWSSTRIKNKIFFKFLFDEKTGEPILRDLQRVIILAGINNIENPLGIIEDLKEMAEVAQNAKIPVSIVQLLPSAGYSFRAHEKNLDVGKRTILRNIKSVNDWIGKGAWAKLPNSGPVMTHMMGDSSGRMVSSNDGIHPTNQGQIHLNKLVRRQIA